MTAAATIPSSVRRAPLWLLSLITFSGTLAMHIFVPALPMAALDLGASTREMQLTVSFYILGLAFGQLVYGPLSDRFGRRPVLIVGLMLYTAAGIAAVFAPTAEQLIAARLFQAFGGCAGLVLGRAMARDGAAMSEAAKRLALMNLMVTVGPGVAPIIGGFLAVHTGWRSILVAVCALGVVNLLLAWRLLPNTGGGMGQDFRTVGRNYRQLITSPAFLGFAIGGGFATTSMYAFVSAAPFIFVDQLHRPSEEVGFYLAAVVGGVWLGSMAASRLADRVQTARLLIFANLLSLIGAVIFLVDVLSGQPSVPVILGSVIIFTLGAGTASPTALTESISVNLNVVGSASGLYGFTQMTIGAACTALAGMGGNPLLAVGLVLTAAGVLAQALFWFALHQKSKTAS